MMRLYFVAGEASGDNHGAGLVQELRERDGTLQFFGRGGPKMRALAGGDFRDWIDLAAVVGLWEVLRHYAFFRREFAATINEIATLKPAAIVLIDYPGFNLRLACALRRRMSAVKIIYYISPQVWAWNRRRVRTMARFVDLMLCIFPFEPELYESAGLRAVFVGHPMVSSAKDEEDAPSRDRRLVALLPGSREREVKKIFPVMRATAQELLRSRPDLHFEVAAASEALARSMRSALSGDESRIIIRVGQTRKVMARAGAAMIASGTATLEATLALLPFVLVYRVSWLTYFAARLVVRVKHLGMPNVLAKREIVPEFIQHKAKPRPIALALARLIDDETARGEMLAAFAEVKRELGRAQTNAADAILAELSLPSGTKGFSTEARS